MRLTNWYVITGAPCSGKTTSIEDLGRRGYRVIHEVARAMLEADLLRGKTLARIKADERAFEQRILYRKVDIESALPTASLLFLDRAVADSIAYYEFSGLDPELPRMLSRAVRYKGIFLFQRGGFQRDRVRSENDHQAAQLEELLRKGYQGLGYDIVEVPWLPVDRRTEWILEHLD